MTVKYSAFFGSGYYFNLRLLSGDIYTADVLHQVGAGWTIDEDVKITSEHLMPPAEKYIPALATDDQVFDCALAEMIERFPEALIELI